MPSPIGKTSKTLLRMIFFITALTGIAALIVLNLKKLKPIRVRK